MNSKLPQRRTPGQQHRVAIPSGEVMNLGRLEAAESGTAPLLLEELDRVVVRWRQTVEDGARNQATQQASWDHLFNRLPLRFKSYQHAIRRRDSIIRDIERSKERGLDISIPDDCPELRRFLVIFDRERDDGSVQGYCGYLESIDRRILDMVGRNTPAPFLAEEARKDHTYIIASTGYGKSELMKVLAHHYISRKSASVVVIDPHRNMARQIAGFPELAKDNRLTYVDAGLLEGYRISFNPLDAGGLSDRERIAAGAELARTLGELVPNAPLTSNMEMLTRYCVRVLMERKGSTLFDLVKMLGSGKNKERDQLVYYGRNHKDERVSYWFRNDFESDSLNSSKDGLRNRLNSLLNNDDFFNMTCRPATFNICDTVERGGVLIFNLASLGDSDTVSAVGRLILATLAGLGKRRALQSDRRLRPVHVFADEAQSLVSPSIGTLLRETRKFGIHLTLAQQVEGGGFDRENKKALEDVPGIHLVGSNNPSLVSRLIGIPSREVERLDKRQFWCRWGRNAEPVKLTVRDDLIDYKYQMKSEEWSERINRMIRDGIYRKDEENPLKDDNFNDLDLV